MCTLGILVIYDSQGIIDDSVIYYTKSLRQAVDDLIIVINGNIELDGFRKLEEITPEIIRRNNTGYDAGGYREAMKQYGKKYFLKFDQVVFSNDTCFGPLIPFKFIFRYMNQRTEDFWGFEYLDNDFLSVIGTFFIVFRRNVMNDVFEFFMRLDTEKMSRSDIVRIVETGIFKYLTSRNYTWTCYSDINNYDLYKSPNYCTKQCGFPLIKKRCFDSNKYVRDNCVDLLKHVVEYYDYNIQLILETIQRKYNLVYDLEYEFHRDLCIQEIKVPQCSLENILHFIRHAKEVYIYGTGFYGKILYQSLKEYAHISGFVVSDEKYEIQSMYDLRVYRYSDVKYKNCKIIVAIMDAGDLKKILCDKEKILFLF